MTDQGVWMVSRLLYRFGLIAACVTAAVICLTSPARAGDDDDDADEAAEVTQKKPSQPADADEDKAKDDADTEAEEPEREDPAPPGWAPPKVVKHLSTGKTASGARPWTLRRRIGIVAPAHTPPRRRPPVEPGHPEIVDPHRLGDALRGFCGGSMTAARARQYGAWIATYAQQYEVDPFVLAALMYRQSRCKPRIASDYGAGLARISEKMEGPHIQRGHYHYFTRRVGRSGTVWEERKLPMPEFAFTASNLKRAQSNLYFAAALLSVYKRQCAHIDAPLRSARHRHYVSHFIWGDRVRHIQPEERVLTARARLLRLYDKAKPGPLGRFRDLALFLPLDDAPRKVSSGFRAKRRRNRHRALDFVSTQGEPVRAVADGKVIFAGVQRRKGKGKARALPPGQAKRVRPSQMGSGGLFVTIQHASGLATGYFHLSGYTVQRGQEIKAGQLIGYVGRTGVRSYLPHLHFEMRYKRRLVDPARYLRPYLIIDAKKPPKSKKRKPRHKPVA